MALLITTRMEIPILSHTCKRIKRAASCSPLPFYWDKKYLANNNHTFFFIILIFSVLKYFKPKSK